MADSALCGLASHSQVKFPQGHTCAVKDCLRVFENSTKLQQHANKTGHKAFQCQCEKRFTKLCSLTRHIKEAVEKPKFECPLRKPHRPGSPEPKYLQCDSELRRISHLKLHLRKIHKSSPEEIEVLLRPFLSQRKRKLAAVSLPEASNSTAATPAVLPNTPGVLHQPATIPDAKWDNSVAALLSGSSAVNQTGLLSTTWSGALSVDPAAHHLASSASFATTAAVGQPLFSNASASFVDSVDYAENCFNPTNTGFPSLPDGGLTSNQNVFGLHDPVSATPCPNAHTLTPTGYGPANMSIHPTTLYGYGNDQLVPYGTTTQQHAFGGPLRGIGLLPQTDYTTALLGGAFGGALAPSLPAPVYGYGQVNQDQVTGVHHNNFTGLAAGNIAAGTAGFAVPAPVAQQFGTALAGFPTAGADFYSQNMAVPAFTTVEGQTVPDLVGGDIMNDFSNDYVGTTLSDAGFC